MNINSDVEYLIDHFNSKKRPLTIIAQELAYSKARKITKLLKSYNEYKLLCSFFDSKLIELYFFKSIFESILYIQHLSLLNPNGLKTRRKILLNSQNSYLNEELVYQFFPEFKNKLKLKQKYYFLRKIKSLLTLIKKNFFFKKEILSKNILEKKNKLGIAAQSGLRDIDGDLSHLRYSSLDKTSFIIYFDKLDKLKSLGGKKYLDNLKKNKYSYVVADTIDFKIDTSFLKNIKSSIKKSYNKDHFRCAIIKITNDLIDEISFWYPFFKHFKIKINYDIENNSKSIISKQIALKLNGGFSFFFQRSYPSIFESQFSAYHPVDYFFCWGLHSQNLWKKSYNYLNKIIIVGKLWSINSKKILDEKLNKFLEPNTNNYYLLIFDTNHSNHKFSLFDNYKKNNQHIPTSEMEKFYLSLINLLNTSNKLKILIKTKKKKLLEDLEVTGKIIKNSNLNKNLFIIDNNNFELLQVKHLISLSVSICFYSPSIFYESIACNIKSVCYDYSNIFDEEKKSFRGEFNSKNIYNDLDLLVEDIKRDIDLKTEDKKNSLGYWKTETRREIVKNIEETGFTKVYEIIDDKFNKII